ncbi:CoA transferase [Rhodococcoides fascians]|uniref:CoA transferase n=1 Tax=Rhodococcoides fascians TaxID=1828 RepID=UPI00050BEA65|nr:CoA transferase [Rhodococcus fascians]
MTATTSSAPLAGIRIVEVSSFVASPLCGLTLSQLGAEVIRVDPVGGGADYNRWPVTDSGASIYWTGLNRGKRSVACDLRSEEGQDLVQRLITAPGEGGGILVTNAGGREWLSHDTLKSLRSDVITLEILGRRDGSPAVDYTVNAATGFPSITGPLDYDGVVNHVLPAWDVTCGIYAALAVTAAVRRRENTGKGTAIRLPLDDVALATAGTLGYTTEVQINDSVREATGNSLYGSYGSDFVTSDGGRFMIVTLTPRHFRDLVAVTDTGDAVKAVETALGVDFSQDSDRYRYRDVLTALFAPWFKTQAAEEVSNQLKKTSVLHERYRTFRETVASPDVRDNPMFAPLNQPRVGTYLAAGSAASFDGEHFHAGPASAVGDDTSQVIADLLGVETS